MLRHEFVERLLTCSIATSPFVNGLCIRVITVFMLTHVVLGYAFAQQSDGDFDGLSDTQEMAIGSDPNDIDTDDDFLTDGEELVAGTDHSPPIATTTD